MVKSGLIGALLLLTLLGHSTGAYAAPGDPGAGSPSGAVYELPFEKGRADAAPVGSGGTTAGGVGGEGASGEGSYYRSENNFGSSSQVPGNPTAGGGSGAGDEPRLGQGGSDVDAEPGPGGVPGAGASSGLSESATHIADSGNTSPAATIALLAMIGLVAVGIGVVASRANRLNSQQ